MREQHCLVLPPSSQSEKSRVWANDRIQNWPFIRITGSRQFWPEKICPGFLSLFFSSSIIVLQNLATNLKEYFWSESFDLTRIRSFRKTRIRSRPIKKTGSATLLKKEKAINTDIKSVCPWTFHALSKRFIHIYSYIFPLFHNTYRDSLSNFEMRSINLF